MDHKRKETIINEIKIWKKSKLLPEHYCDFLLTLYTEGEGQGTEDSPKGYKQFFIALLLLVFVPITLLVIYFTEINFVLQMPIFIIFIIICIFSAFFLKNNFLKHVALIVAALIFLLISLESSEYFFPNNQNFLLGTVFFNCLIWVAAGIKMGKIYFLIAGILGMLSLIVSLFI